MSTPRKFEIRFLIDGVNYGIVPRTPRSAYRILKLNSNGKPTTSYEVKKSGQQFTCTCLGFRKGYKCKHLRTLTASGMIA